jgi:hypothetical protein
MTNTTSNNNNNTNNNIYLKNTQKSNTIKIKIKPQTNSPVADCVADVSKSKNTRDQVDSNSSNKSKDTSQINILSPASILTKDILDNDDAVYCSSHALRSIQNKCNESILNESNQIKTNDNTTTTITASTNPNNKQLFNTNNYSSNNINRYSQMTTKPNGKSSDIFSLSGRVMDNKNLKSSIVINTLQQTQSSPQTERQASYLKLACYLNGYDSFRSSAEKGDIKLTDERHEEKRNQNNILPEKQDLNGLTIEAPKLDVKNQSIEETILPIATTVIEEVSLKSVEEKEIPALINDKLKETDSDIINEKRILSTSEPSNVDKEKNSIENVSESQPVVQVMI